MDKTMNITDAIINLRINSKIKSDELNDKIAFNDVNERIKDMIYDSADIKATSFIIKEYDERIKKLKNRVSIANYDEVMPLREDLVDLNYERSANLNEIEKKTDDMKFKMKWFNDEAEKIGQPKIFDITSNSAAIKDMNRFSNELETFAEKYTLEYESKETTNEKIDDIVKEELSDGIKMDYVGASNAKKRINAVLKKGMAQIEMEAMKSTDKTSNKTF